MDLNTSAKVYEILTNVGITNSLKIYKIFLSEKDKVIDGLQKNEYDELVRIFLMTDSNRRIIVLKKIYDYISKDDYKYNLFIEAYCYSEGNFRLNNKILTDIKKNFQKSHRETINIEGEYVDIYRGVNSISTVIGDDLSWSTNKETAIWFAKRVKSGDSCLYRGKIKKDNIICFITTRGENEVLAKYKDVEDISRIFITDM
ncbi:hypothetical protein KPL47_07965 [Clostridium estertheticum]|uniref:hypothetical protein n=1 Tax=Clostridium estertheticum TaxID=238834 RepID=UPI001C0AE797|nr:hypothetical protein [Clostridium estertheticum]MBU3176305.1 hypothetical protein [Clostridium estertheticum]